MRTRNIVLTLVIAAFIGALLGPAQSSAIWPFTKKEAKGEPIKIGAIFAVTGPASFLGAPEAKTAEMLVEKINAEGGVHRPPDRADHQGQRRQPGEGRLLRQAAHRGRQGPGHHRPLHQRRDDADQAHLRGRQA